MLNENDSIQQHSQSLSGFLLHWPLILMFDNGRDEWGESVAWRDDLRW